MTTTTYVAYDLKGEDYTAILVAKKGLFWDVQDPDTMETKKIPAKAVTETWEESDTPVAAEPTVEAYTPPELPNLEGTPSLAEQLAEGPAPESKGPTITLQELADDQGFEPRIARRKLRAATADQLQALGVTHEAGGGWIFPRDSIEGVMHIITARQRG